MVVSWRWETPTALNLKGEHDGEAQQRNPFAEGFPCEVG